VYVNGVVTTAVVTLVGANYTFTFSPAPANGAVIVAQCEYL
jgi:hypothetical protein